jgi:aconitate hydratase
MGILPLQFLPGESAATLGLTGRESYTVELPADGPVPRGRVNVAARDDAAEGGAERRFEATVRLDGPIELDYYRQGGILPTVLRRIARESMT